MPDLLLVPRTTESAFTTRTMGMPPWALLRMFNSTWEPGVDFPLSKSMIFSTSVGVVHLRDRLQAQCQREKDRFVGHYLRLISGELVSYLE